MNRNTPETDTVGSTALALTTKEEMYTTSVLC
jgi:hypothetical protein